MKPDRKTALLLAALFIVAAGALLYFNGKDSSDKPARDPYAAALQRAEADQPNLGVEVPPNLPDYAPLPEGAFVVTASGTEDSPSGMMEFSVTGTPEELLDFYKDAVADAGMESEETQEGEWWVLTATNKNAQLKTEVSEAPGDGVFVRLTFGPTTSSSSDEENVE